MLLFDPVVRSPSTILASAPHLIILATVTDVLVHHSFPGRANQCDGTLRQVIAPVMALHVTSFPDLFISSSFVISSDF